MAKSPSKSSQNKSSTAASIYCFEEPAYHGKPICLLQRTWDNHILVRHADMADYYESIISESTNPQVVLDDGVPDVLIHASFGVGKGKYLNELLWIPIEFTEDRGTILSAYFVPKIKGDVIRVVEWRKKK